MSEINLNLANMLFAQAMPGLDGGLGMNGQNLALLDGNQDGKGFVDVLSLAEDLQVADEQLTGLEDFNKKSFGLVQDPMANIKAQSLGAASVLNSQVPALAKLENQNEQISNLQNNIQRVDNSRLFVGQLDLAPQVQVETLPQNINLQSVLVEKFDLKAGGEQILENKKQDLPLTQESVAAWSVALAKGDVKKVQVEQKPIEMSPLKTNVNTQMFLSQAAPQAVQQANQQNQSMVNSAPANVVKNAPKSEEPTLTNKEIRIKEKVEAPASLSINNNRQEELQNKGSQNQSFSQDKHDKKEEGAYKSNLTASKKVEVGPMKASDFVLNNSVHSAQGFQNSQELKLSQNVGKNEPVVAGLGALGAHSDNRISAPTLGFVGDKVEQLRAQGGGVLRVHLTPVELGAVEIEVQKGRTGDLEVKISAEKPETLQALKNAQQELFSRIEQSAKASKLEIASLKSQSGISPLSTPAGASTEKLSAGELLNLRESLKSEKGSALKEAQSARHDIVNEASVDHQDNSRVVRIDEMAKSSSDLGRETGSGFSREQSRDKAMNAWEEEIRKRKTA